MKNTKTLFLTTFFFLLSLSGQVSLGSEGVSIHPPQHPTHPDFHFPNRANVLRAGQALATEIEHLDEALHDAHAPDHFIQKVHHTEETVKEFLNLVRNQGTYAQARNEFNHIRKDIRMIDEEFRAHPQLLQYPKVRNEYYHTRSAYRYLDHEMFRHFENRHTAAQLQQLQRDVALLMQHQQNR